MPLMAVARCGHLAIFRILMEAAPESYGMVNWDDIFLRACSYNHELIAREIITKHSMRPHTWQEVIQYAAAHGRDNIIRMCVEHGAIKDVPLSHWQNCLNIVMRISIACESTRELLSDIIIAVAAHSD
jgi:hypothetical protein